MTSNLTTSVPELGLNSSDGNTTYETEPSGPVDLSLSIFGGIMVVTYGLMCIVGLIGNGLVVFVILRYTKMKTVTNMYILNLSTADFLFMVCLPMLMTTVITKHWVFGYALCKIYYIQTCINMFTGAFTLLVMSGDRYLAVCYPISSMRYRTANYAMMAIAGTWIVSFLVMLPVVLYAQQIPHSYPGWYSCHIQWPTEGGISPEKAFICYTLLLGFVVPCFLISILYTLLIIRLRTTGPKVKSAEKKRSHRKVTKLVTLIICVYIICWLPYWAFQVHLIVQDQTQLAPWKIYMFQVFTSLSYANSMVNPCMYAFTNDNFRESFIRAFRCKGDPLLTGRRSSELNSTTGTTVGNNNHTCNSSATKSSKKFKNDPHTEYEFTTLNSTTGTEQEVQVEKEGS